MFFVAYVLCFAMYSVSFAQESSDFVAVDSLTKISLDYSENTNFVDTNKVGHVDAGISQNIDSFAVFCFCIFLM